MEASDFIKEFRVMIIRILKSMKKDIGNIKRKDQSEIKNAITEIIPREE